MKTINYVQIINKLKKMRIKIGYIIIVAGMTTFYYNIRFLHKKYNDKRENKI